MKKNIILSFLILILFLSSNAQVPGCGDFYYDPGGSSSNYTNNLDVQTTILPTIPGTQVTVTFLQFDVEATFDGLYVFDGNSISAPQISSTNAAANVPGGLPGAFWGTTIPGPFTSSSPDGSLTFRFRSDFTATRLGWVAVVSCSPPPTCPIPTSLATSNPTTSSITLSWNSNSSASSWQVIALPCGSPIPTASSTGWQLTTANPFTFTGLNPDTCYTFYVRNVCSESDISNWSVGLNRTTLQIPPLCGGVFTDNGGANGNYLDNSDSTVVICPTNVGDLVTVTFTQFNTSPNADGLYVFDGNSINAPQIASTNGPGIVPGGLAGAFWGTTLPGPFTSSSADGCLTFRFRSTPQINLPGWIANVTCAPAPTCPRPNGLTATSTTTNQTTLNWNSNSTATTWNILALPCGSPLPTSTTGGWQTATTNPFTFTGLNPDTCYTFYVRGVCSSTDTSAWSPGTNVSTQPIPPACGGIFTDPGGSNSNYPDNSDTIYTICTPSPGQIVTVTFTQFNTQSTNDGLYVFDGDSINAPQIVSGNGAGGVPGGVPGSFWGTSLPGPFSSTNVQGCLTFRFRSNATVNASGWIANVTCTIAPDQLVLMAFLDSNNNGIKETSENFFKYGSYLIEKNNSGITNYVNTSSNFHTILDSNPNTIYKLSYEILPEFSSYYTTPMLIHDNISIPLGSGTQIFYFPVTVTQIHEDVSVSIIPISQPRPGFNYVNRIVYTNLGTTTASGQLTFEKDNSNVTLTGISQPGVTITANGFTHNFNNLLPNESRSINVIISVPTIPTVSIGDYLTNSASITTNLNEVNLVNNSFANKENIIATNSPNDKVESYGGTVLHSTFTTNNYLYYTIRFENTGVESVRSISIEDVLNSQLDATTISTVDASHPYVFSRNGSSLNWFFENINLPVSIPNLPVGKGYVTFKVKPFPDYEIGDIIPNSASLIFESSPAIVTNTFNTEFIGPLVVDDYEHSTFVIYPNPTNSILNIQIKELSDEIKSVEIIDVLGKVIKNQTNVNSNQTNLNLESLSKGVYLVKVTTKTGLKMNKKVMVK